MAEFTPITTQEAFDEAIKSRLERGVFCRKLIIRVLACGLQQLSNLIGRVNTALRYFYTAHAEELTGSIGGLKAQIDELSKKVSTNETDSAKTRIAYQMGLPYEMSTRLVGSTEDEIRKDAEALQRLVGGARAQPMFSPEGGEGDAKDAALRKMLGDMKN